MIKLSISNNKYKGCYEIKVGNNTLFFNGVHVVYSKDTVVSCFNDVFSEMQKAYSDKNEMVNIDDLCIGSLQGVYRINNNDIFLDFVNKQMLIFLNEICQTQNSGVKFNGIEMHYNLNTKLKLLYPLIGSKIEFLCIATFDVEHIVIDFSNKRSMAIYSFWKITHNNETVFCSTQIEDTDGCEELINNALLSKTILNIWSHEDFIYKISLSDGYDIYIYIDNYGEKNPQIVLYENNFVERLQCDKKHLKIEHYKSELPLF